VEALSSKFFINMKGYNNNNCNTSVRIEINTRRRALTFLFSVRDSTVHSFSDVECIVTILRDSEFVSFPYVLYAYAGF
jgi:hypothetical protein